MRDHLGPLPGFLRGGGDVLLHTPQCAHKGADTDTADHIYGYARFDDSFEHAYVSSSSRTAATQHEADRSAGQPSRESAEIAVHVWFRHEYLGIQLVLQREEVSLITVQILQGCMYVLIPVKMNEMNEMNFQITIESICMHKRRVHAHNCHSSSWSVTHDSVL